MENEILSIQENACTKGRSLVVVQLSPFCNINCKYCYLPDRPSTQRMELSTFSLIAQSVLESKKIADPINFLYHSGEPLILPIEFYRTIFQIINEKNLQHKRVIMHTVQTNATLINEDWISLFKQHNVGIGVSLDGPDFIHNHSRIDRSGKGTHAKVMRGVKLLQNANIPFGVIMVLTKFALDYPEEIYRFFTDNDIKKVAFNIDEISQMAKSSYLATEEVTTKYKKFMFRFMELVEQNSRKLKVREFKHLSQILLSAEMNNGTLMRSVTNPFDIVSFDVNGNYSTFCPELRAAKSIDYQDFIMGNVTTQKIDDMVGNKNFQIIYSEIAEGIEACKQTCAYWKFCGGGNPSNKFFEHGKLNGTETLTCRIHLQALTDTMINYLSVKASL